MLLSAKVLFSLILLSAMTSTAVEEEWHDSSEETRPSSFQTDQRQDASPEDNATARRSSRRLANKSSQLCIGDWPVAKILESLFLNDIQSPRGTSHEDLFALLCDSVAIPVVESPPVPPPQSGKKHTSKRKNPETANKAPAQKRVTCPVRPGPSAFSDDPVLMALSDIQSSLLGMSARISTLEDGSLSTSTTASTSAVVSDLHHPRQPQSDDVTTEFLPKRTLATAVPFSTGSPFFPPAAAISHQLRGQILAGNDINLVKLLLGSELCERPACRRLW